VKPKILKERVNEHERLILDALAGGGRMASGRLYNRYAELAAKAKAEPVSDRSFRGYVNHLGETGMLEISEKKVGKSRLISLKAPK